MLKMMTETGMAFICCLSGTHRGQLWLSGHTVMTVRTHMGLVFLLIYIIYINETVWAYSSEVVLLSHRQEQ